MSFDPLLLIPYLLITLIVLTAVILLSALLSARGAGRIKPAQAIRFGAPARDFSRSRSISLKGMKYLPVPAMLEKKLYGIMKNSGMTPVGLRLSLLARTVAAALLGILVGVPTGLWIAPNILSFAMLEMGIANYPAVIYLPGTLAAVLAALAIAALSTWIPSGKVMTISSRNLIVE